MHSDNCKMMLVLDDLKYIHQKDVQDALGVVSKQWQQLLQEFDVRLKNTSQISNVVVAGMGGSALAASIVPTWPGIAVPYEVVRNYNIPSFVGQNTLFIASSYSGNTEETISALNEAETAKAQIVIIAAGGKLEEIATKKKYPFYKIPQGYQPRMAVFYNYSALIQLLESLGLCPKNSYQQLKSAANWLNGVQGNWLPEVAKKYNQAKSLALELMGKSVVIYAGPKLFPVAYKWKININENAKNVAWAGQLPEFNHNEFLGWSSHPTDKLYAVVDIRSNLEHPRTQIRFDLSERLLSGKRPSPEVIYAEGKDILEQLLWSITLGDFTSLYLALLNGLNPTPVELIEKFKKSLDG